MSFATKMKGFKFFVLSLIKAYIFVMKICGTYET